MFWCVLMQGERNNLVVGYLESSRANSDSLFRVELCQLFEICAGGEARVHRRSNNQRPRRTLDVILGPRHFGARKLAVLRLDGLDLLAQRREEGVRDGIGGGRPVELQHADVSAVRRGQVDKLDHGAGLGIVFGPSMSWNM